MFAEEQQDGVITAVPDADLLKSALTV